MNYCNFWKRVIELLNAAKISRKQFAEYLDVPHRTLEGWICYDRIPDTLTAYDMSRLLGVTLDYLAGGVDRDFTAKRLKELAARESAVRINDLASQIDQESRRIYHR